MPEHPENGEQVEQDPPVRPGEDPEWISFELIHEGTTPPLTTMIPEAGSPADE